MNNVIILKNVYGKGGKGAKNGEQTFFMNPCVDPRTGRLPSCVRSVNANGDMILSEQERADMNSGKAHYVPADKVFSITDGYKFDLDDVIEKAEWESIKNSSLIAKDRNERNSAGELIIDGGAKRYGTAELYIERPGEATKTRVSKKQLIHRASTYVYDDSESNRILKARVLGRDLRTAMPADVLDYLILFAEKDPNKVIELYEGDDLQIHLMLLESIDRGVIRKAGGLYSYAEKSLGGNLEQVIMNLRDVRYNSILKAIKKDTYPEYSTKSQIADMENDIFTNTPFDPNNSDDSELNPIPSNSAKGTKKK